SLSGTIGSKARSNGRYQRTGLPSRAASLPSAIGNAPCRYASRTASMSCVSPESIPQSTKAGARKSPDPVQSTQRSETGQPGFPTTSAAQAAEKLTMDKELIELIFAGDNIIFVTGGTIAI